MKPFLRASLLLAAGMAAGLLGAAPEGPRGRAPERYRIALVLADPGVSRFTGSVIRGIEMAAADLTAKYGDTFELKQYLTVDESAESTAKVMREVKAVHPDLVIGDIYASQAMVGAAAAEAAGLLYVTTTASSPEIVDGRKLVFRSCYNDRLFSRIMTANLALEGKKNVHLIYDDSRLHLVAEEREFAAALQKAGLHPTAQELNRMTSDYAPYLANVKREAPDALFLGTDVRQSMVLLAKLHAARQEGFWFVGSSRYGSEQFLATMGRMGIRFPIQWLANAPFDLERHPRTAAVAARFKALHKEKMGALSVAGYDTLGLFRAAATEARSHAAPAVAAAWRALAFEGLAGRYEYRGGQDPEKTVYLRRRSVNGLIDSREIAPGSTELKPDPSASAH